MNHINEVTTEEVESLQNDNNTIIIDVREDEEVAHGIIENAKHIPLDKIPHAAKELNKNNHYILVCRSGGRSLSAASYLDERGFKVSNMVGGMLDWKGEVVF